MLAILYVIFVFLGFYLVFLTSKRGVQFLWREYVAMFIAPVVGMATLSFIFGPTPFYMFLAGMVVGTPLEWLLGFTYHKIFGSRLWIYERFYLPGRYASYLTIPIWGTAFVAIWLITH